MKKTELLSGFIMIAIAMLSFRTAQSDIKKEDVPGSIVTFYYYGFTEDKADLEDTNNYSTTSNSTTKSGTEHLYTITFNNTTYPLTGEGKPNSTVLNKYVTTWVPGDLAGTFGTSGISYINKANPPNK